MNKKTALISLALIASFVTGAFASYIWYSVNIPVHIQEPLQVTLYPTQIQFYAGENHTFDISIHNYANVNYSVTLAFTLNDSAYQTQYVTFSNTLYTIRTGTTDQIITAWMKVSADAPPANLTLTVDFSRASPT